MAKTSTRQKIGLIIGSLILAVMVLEIGLRLGGVFVLYWRDRANQARLAGKSEFRIMCVGESTTYCGDSYSGYPRQLERILNEKDPEMKFVVINKGKPGCSTAFILKRLEGWLDGYTPDMVIAMMGINDGMGDEPGLYQDDEQSGGLGRFLGNLRTWKMARYIWENGLLTLREKGILGQPPPAEEGVTAAKNFNAGDDDYDYDAEANLQDKLKNNPRDAGVYIELGQKYLDRDWYEEALEMFNKAVAIDPENGEANLGLARYYLNQQSHKTTLELCRKVLKVNPAKDEAWVISGLSFMNEHKWGPAAEKLRHALEINPSNDEALAALGWCYWKLKNFPEAEKVSVEAIAINPANSWASGILALCYKRQGNYQAALEVYQEAIEFLPYSPQVHKEIGQLYQELGKPELAGEYFRKAKSLALNTYNPRTFRNYNQMKEILDRRGIPLVSVQYPVRNIGPLKKMLSSYKDIIFVDNEKVFKEALSRTEYSHLFKDNFGVDFGHCTAEGNRLLAENIAGVLFREYFRLEPELEIGKNK